MQDKKRKEIITTKSNSLPLKKTKFNEEENEVSLVDRILSEKSLGHFLIKNFSERVKIQTIQDTFYAFKTILEDSKLKNKDRIQKEELALLYYRAQGYFLMAPSLPHTLLDFSVMLCKHGLLDPSILIGDPYEYNLLPELAKSGARVSSKEIKSLFDNLAVLAHYKHLSPIPIKVMESLLGISCINYFTTDELRRVLSNIEVLVENKYLVGSLESKIIKALYDKVPNIHPVAQTDITTKSLELTAICSDIYVESSESNATQPDITTESIELTATQLDTYTESSEPTATQLDIYTESSEPTATQPDINTKSGFELNAEMSVTTLPNHDISTSSELEISEDTRQKTVMTTVQSPKRIGKKVSDIELSVDNDDSTSSHINPIIKKTKKTTFALMMEAFVQNDVHALIKILEKNNLCSPLTLSCSTEKTISSEKSSHDFKLTSTSSSSTPRTPQNSKFFEQKTQENKDGINLVTAFFNTLYENRAETRNQIATSNAEFFEIMLSFFRKNLSKFYHLIENERLDLVLKHLPFVELEKLMSILISPFCLHMKHNSVLLVLESLDKRIRMCQKNGAMQEVEKIRDIQDDLLTRSLTFHQSKHNLHGHHTNVTSILLQKQRGMAEKRKGENTMQQDSRAFSFS